MNNVVLMGRLTKDPEIRYSAGDSASAFARFRIAVNRRFKREGQPDADFFDCVVFGRTVEFVEKYLHQGSKIVLQGRIQNDNYTDKDGRMVYRDRIVVENLEFAESKAASQANGSYRAPAQSAPSYDRPMNSGQAAPLDTPADGFMNIPEGIEEGLPFI